MLLFRCATGESWQAVMLACKDGAECHSTTNERHSAKSMKCGSFIAYPYFCSFVFLSSFLMLNLFVAVIMDNFDYLTRDSSILGAHHLDEFLRSWSEYDPDGTGKLEYTKMFEMLRLMSPPVGFGTKCPSKLAYKRLIRMNMPIDDKRQVHFTTTLFALIRESLSIKMRAVAEEMDEADNELRDVICKLWPNLAKKPIKLHEGGTKSLLDLVVPPKTELHGIPGFPKLTVGKVYAICLYVDNYRSYKQGHSNDTGFNLNRLVCALKERAHSREGINDHEYDPRRGSFRPSGSFRRNGSNRSSNMDNAFANKNKTTPITRPNAPPANGFVNQPANKVPNLINFDDGKRTGQQTADSSTGQPHYGRTLNVPDGNVLSVLPQATPAAPTVRPRPAIMSTPKSSTAAAKNLSLDLPPAETRPMLLVTAGNDQRQPQTTTVPNNRQLPLNGKLTPIPPVQPQRQQPSIPTMANATNSHQMINEVTTKKQVNSRPRTALFFTTTRNADQSPSHQPLLDNGNNASNRYDSIDLHNSDDDMNDNWSAAPKILPSTPASKRTLPTQNQPPPANVAQPRPPAMNTTRQLPPVPVRQLPNVAKPTLPAPFFNLQHDEDDEEALDETFNRSNELFYYQTSTSSSSNNSMTSENNEEQFQTDQQEDDADDDDEDNQQNQRLQSDDDDDDQTSPFEYDA